MARQSTTKQSNSFINGIVTDSNEFAAPENAALDMENVVINQKGEARRRKGLEVEPSGSAAVTTTVVADDCPSHCVRWKGAGPFRASNVTICQEGDTLRVYDDNDSSWPASASTLLLSSVLTLAVSLTEASRCDMVPGSDGSMYVTTGISKPLRLEYDSSVPALTASILELVVRDTDYLNDGYPFWYAVPGVYGTPNANYFYNKVNSGWSGTYIQNYHTANARHPAKSLQVFRAKTVAGLPDYGFLDNLASADAPAPVGAYMWPLWLSNRGSVVAGTPDERVIPAGTGPTTCAFYANRVWYMGFTTTSASPDALGTQIFYSQIINPTSLITSDLLAGASAVHESYEACYSTNDPTSEYQFEILATDGGSIAAPGIGDVRRAMPVGSSLILFASNGIFAIDGGFGEVFKSDKFALVKISEEKVVSYGSIVEAGVSLYCWGEQGIVRITPLAGDGRKMVVEDISEGRIHDAYINILNSYDYIDSVEGFYDERNRYVEWTYSVGSGSEEKKGHTHILRYNLKTQAVTRLKVLSPLIPPRRLGGMTLFNNAGEKNKMYYLTRTANAFGTTLSTEWHAFTNDTDWKDYPSTAHEGELLPWITLWPEHLGVPHLNKQALYIHTFIRRTEVNWISSGTFDNESGLTVTAWMDWSENTDDGKQSGPHDVYRLLRLPADPGSGYPVALDYKPTIVINKTKLKGKGRAIQLKFDGVAEKDFQLMGWSLPIHIETS